MLRVYIDTEASILLISYVNETNCIAGVKVKRVGPAECISQLHAGSSDYLPATG